MGPVSCGAGGCGGVIFASRSSSSRGWVESVGLTGDPPAAAGLLMMGGDDDGMANDRRSPAPVCE